MSKTTHQRKLVASRVIPLNVPRAAPGSHTPHLHPENRANVESVWEQELRESWPSSCLFLTSKTKKIEIFLEWATSPVILSSRQRKLACISRNLPGHRKTERGEKKLTYFYFYLIIFRTLEAASREEM